MRHLVLGIGYPFCTYREVRREWARYDVEFHFVDGLEMALEMLARHDYVCIAISSDGDSHTLIDELHRIKHIPVVVISPACAIG